MRVLWITNILFPEVMEKLTGDKDLKATGGWMLGAADALLAHDDVTLYVASVSPLVKELTYVEGEKIRYYVIPYGSGNLKINPEYQPYWKQIASEVSPDVVHIHGTEYSHGHAYMKACGAGNVVISIQGLKSEYSKCYLAGLTNGEILRNFTIKDILKGSILTEQKRFRISSGYEYEMISMIGHVIGRTAWDKTVSAAINPQVYYHFCNETLRDAFYDGHLWDYSRCEKHTMFLSQAGYPIKGLHQVLKAMPVILKEFPDAKVRVAGADITKCDTFHDFIRLSGYGKYIKRLIRKLNLQGKVIFTGNLNAEQMKREYLLSNVFVCPSSIENSPNSLGEAQILGVPCVASQVGGVADMMKGNEENLYDFEDVDALAGKVCKIFNDREAQLSMVKVASERHDRTTNSRRLLDIYNSIISDTDEI